MTRVQPSLRGVVFGLFILGPVFLLLEWFWPANSRQPRWREDSRADLAYWFLTPLATKSVTRLLIYGLFAAAALCLGAQTLEQWLHPHGLVARQAGWVQALELLFLGDLVGYWSHRLFHRPRLWPFHAIHHSSTQLDWLSAVRLHPVNDALSRLAQVVVLLPFGFAPKVMAAYVPFVTFYAILLHANVRCSLGPFRYFIASPTFHRWHHTSEREGLDKNFAGLFSFLDLLFGTFYMPQGRHPERFGIAGPPPPSNVLGQLAYPFRRASR